MSHRDQSSSKAYGWINREQVASFLVFTKKLLGLLVLLSIQVTEDQGKCLGRTERTNLLILLILVLHNEIYLEFH